MKTPATPPQGGATRSLETEHSSLLTGQSYLNDLKHVHRPGLFILSGPSGVGKDSLIQELRSAVSNIHVAVTATTRAPRNGEVAGVHYHFLPENVFAERMNDGWFLETANVYGMRYGTPASEVSAHLAQGNDVILKIDVQGAAEVRSIRPDAISIFIAPESLSALRDRLLWRKTDDPDKLERRFAAASRELLEADKFDFVVFNESANLGAAVADVAAIIRAERLRIRSIEPTT